MSRSQSPHYRISHRGNPSRKFPWDEPGFDPKKVVAHLDARPQHRELRSREESSPFFNKEDVEAPGFRGNRRPSYPDEMGRRTPPYFPDKPNYGEHRRLSPNEPHHRHDGQVKAGRWREEVRDHSVPGGRSRNSPQCLARERLPSSDFHSMDPSIGWRKGGHGRNQERPRNLSPRAPDRQGRGEEMIQERRDKRSHMESRKEDPYRDRSPISNQHGKGMEGHVHPGYGEEEEVELRHRPRDGYREAIGDVRGLKPLVVEHGHGFIKNRGPPEWDMIDGGCQDMMHHSRPRQMGFQPTHDGSSNRSEPWAERETDSGCESRRGPMGNDKTNQPGKFPLQKGQDNFRGRMDIGRRGGIHDRKLAASPMQNPPHSQKFPQGPQYFSQELQDFPRPGRQEFPRPGRQEFPRPGRQEFPRPGRQEFPRPGRQEFPKQGRQEFPKQGRQEFTKQGHQEFPKQGHQEFPKQGHQEFPKQGHQEFPKQGHQEFPRPGHQEFPKQGCQEFPKQGRQEFPKQGHQEFPKQGHQEFPKQGHQEFPKQGHQEFPKQRHQEFSKQGLQQFPPDHTEFNQGCQGQTYREQRENDCDIGPRQEDPGWGKHSKPNTERSTMSNERSRPLDPVMPSGREHRLNNQKESSEVMEVSEETLTIKVDMNRPVSKNSALCYSSDRQLSLDLVNVGRQRLDFLPMMEHSGTYSENTVRSGTFAQEIITLVHQVKEQYFRGNAISLNQRFSTPQDGLPKAQEDKVATEDQRPTLNKRFTMTMNTVALAPVFALQPEPQEPPRDPDDLRNNLERRRQERTEGVKITISGGAHGAPGPSSEPAAMFGERFGEQEGEAGFPERPANAPQGPTNLKFQRRGAAPFSQHVAPRGRANARVGNRLGPHPSDRNHGNRGAGARFREERGQFRPV